MLCDSAPNGKKGWVLIDGHRSIDNVRCHVQSVKLNTDSHCVSCGASGCGRGGADDGCVIWGLLNDTSGLWSEMRRERREERTEVIVRNVLHCRYNSHFLRMVCPSASIVGWTAIGHE